MDFLQYLDDGEFSLGNIAAVLFVVFAIYIKYREYNNTKRMSNYRIPIKMHTNKIMLEYKKIVQYIAQAKSQIKIREAKGLVSDEKLQQVLQNLQIQKVELEKLSGERGLRLNKEE